MENTENLKNVGNNVETENIVENKTQEKKKDKKIFLVLSLLTLSVFLMLQIPIIKIIDLSWLGELGSELDNFLIESSLGLLYDGIGAATLPLKLTIANILLFSSMLFFIGHVLLNVKNKVSKLICILTTIGAMALLGIHYVSSLHVTVLFAAKLLGSEMSPIYEFGIIFFGESIENLVKIVSFFADLAKKLEELKSQASCVQSLATYGILVVFMINYIVLLFRTEMYIVRKISATIFMILFVLVFVLLYSPLVSEAIYSLIKDITFNIFDSISSIIMKIIFNVLKNGGYQEYEIPLMDIYVEMKELLASYRILFIGFIIGVIALIKNTKNIYMLIIIIISSITYLVQTKKFIKTSKLKGLGVLLFIFGMFIFAGWVVLRILGAFGSIFLIFLMWLGIITG